MAIKREGMLMTAIHPGEFLREDFLAPLELSANALALALRVPATRIAEIVNGRRGISADTALRLAKYFGTSAHYWLSMQQAYDLATAHKAVGAAINRDVERRAA